MERIDPYMLRDVLAIHDDEEQVSLLKVTDSFPFINANERTMHSTNIRMPSIVPREQKQYCSNGRDNRAGGYSLCLSVEKQ